MPNPLYRKLKSYILRKLGSPVINIEITDDQLEDCIEEAMHEYRENHFNGTFIAYVPLKLIAGQTEYKLKDEVQEVVNILSSQKINYSWTGNDPILINAYYLGNEHYTLYQYDLLSVEVFNQKFKMISEYYEVPILFDYNEPTSKLYLHAPPDVDVDCFLKVYTINDKDIKEHLDENWVKRYSRELARLQWGTNLMKYQGTSLPGGAQFNYTDIVTMAQTNLDKLMEELEDDFSLPLDPLVG